MTFICRLGHLITSLLKVDLLLLGQKSVLLQNKSLGKSKLTIAFIHQVQN